MLNNSKNIGINALKKACGLEDKEITAYHLGFVIGPCLNASGRLDSAKKGLKMLLSEDENEARTFAKELVKLNEERKDMTAKGVEDAIEIVEGTSIINDKVFVIYLPHIHESLAGIIAGRIREKYNVPVIVLTKSEHGVKGSGRSIEEYDMFEELVKCKDLLDKFGGHPMAAGLSLAEDNIDNLRKRLNENTKLSEEDLLKKITIDTVLPLDAIDYDVVEDIGKLEPFGKANSKPLFGEKNINILKGFVLGKNKNVLKLRLKTDKGRTMDAVYFGDIDEFENYICEKYSSEELQKLYDGAYNDVKLDLVFYPSINEYNGMVSIQIIIQNYR